MKTYSCPKCGSIDVFIDDRGTQKALCCGDCGAWLKWIGKKELPLVERWIDENNLKENEEIEIFKSNLNHDIQRFSITKKQILEIINKIYI